MVQDDLVGDVHGHCGGLVDLQHIHHHHHHHNHYYYSPAAGWFKTIMWVMFTIIAVGWWIYNTYIIVNSYLKYEANVNIELT